MPAVPTKWGSHERRVSGLKGVVHEGLRDTSAAGDAGNPGDPERSRMPNGEHGIDEHAAVLETPTSAHLRPRGVCRGAQRERRADSESRGQAGNHGDDGPAGSTPRAGLWSAVWPWSGPAISSLSFPTPCQRSPTSCSNDERFWFWFQNRKDKSVYYCDYTELSSTSLAVTYQPDWIVGGDGAERDHARRGGPDQGAPWATARNDQPDVRAPPRRVARPIPGSWLSRTAPARSASFG